MSILEDKDKTFNFNIMSILKDKAVVNNWYYAVYQISRCQPGGVTPSQIQTGGYPPSQVRTSGGGSGGGRYPLMRGAGWGVLPSQVQAGYLIPLSGRIGCPPPPPLQMWTDWKYYLPPSFGCGRQQESISVEGHRPPPSWFVVRVFSRLRKSSCQIE